jgi:ADP-heptose:LPS heptosyltransferase
MQKNSEPPEKILLIRFSSFGDVVQTLSVLTALKQRWPEAEIHWVTRSEFIPLIEPHPALQKAWGLKKRDGVRGLWQLAQQLSAMSFDRVYDAHNNLRSIFLCLYLWTASLTHFNRPPAILRRSLRRWKRFLLFKLRINLFEQPFSGQRDLLEPLEPWNISKIPAPSPQLFISEVADQKVKPMIQRLIPIHHLQRTAPQNFVAPNFVALAPSAAFPLKRWPLEHWKSLLQLWMSQDSEIKFVLLGGPEDTFLAKLVALAPDRILNWAGPLKLEESAAVVRHSKLLIANDTGLLHVGEQLGHPTIALMGPAPFGFPCRRETTKILELSLSCRPCSKHGQGPCTNARFQWCLAGINPEMVFDEARALMNRKSPSSLTTGPSL